MHGVTGSKHWTEEKIYEILNDGAFHSFDEIYQSLLNQEKYYLTRNNLSCILFRIRKKNPNILHYKYGVFKLNSIVSEQSQS